VLYPLDLVKTRIQSQFTADDVGDERYTGIV
jgi:hypothetical protein